MRVFDPESGTFGPFIDLNASQDPLVARLMDRGNVFEGVVLEHRPAAGHMGQDCIAPVVMNVGFNPYQEPHDRRPGAGQGMGREAGEETEIDTTPAARGHQGPTGGKLR